MSVDLRDALLRIEHEGKPCLLIDATYPGVQVPSGYVKDGKIVLNISAGAIRNQFAIDGRLEFDAQFNGQAHHIRIPANAVLAVYSAETGKGVHLRGALQ